MDEYMQDDYVDKLKLNHEFDKMNTLDEERDKKEEEDREHARKLREKLASKLKKDTTQDSVQANIHASNASFKGGYLNSKLREKGLKDQAEKEAHRKQMEVETATRIMIESEMDEQSKEERKMRVNSLMQEASSKKLTILQVLEIEEKENAERQRKAEEEERRRLRDSAKQTALAAIKEKIINFYNVHNPTKVKEVDELLAKYRGREEELLSKLHAQYGVSAKSEYAPKKEASIRDRLREFYRVHNPSKVDDVDLILLKYKGNEQALFEKLKAQYNTDKI